MVPETKTAKQRDIICLPGGQLLHLLPPAGDVVDAVDDDAGETHVADRLDAVAGYGHLQAGHTLPLAGRVVKVQG